METLQHLLTRCLGELREWRAGHPDAARYPEEFYARVERSLRQLRRIHEPEDAARLVTELELRIRDEGPLSEAFLPSLEDLHEAVARADA
ncbi:MAG TPA: hypothetical protein VKB65_00635 [Myxococcota bacterium]|nr:hypothetical protein [Myxococcota bacterium]